MFKNAKVGDRVYDLRYGYGEIDEIWDGDAHTKPISVEFENGCNAHFHRDGRHWAEDPVPFLYWSKPEIAAPPPPKRTVKRGGWINLYQCTVHQTEEGARRAACGDAIARVFVEYECDE